MRRLSRNLRPSVLDHLGLAAALQVLVDDLQAVGLDVTLVVRGDAGRLDDRARTALFRIAQEALTNVRRHSGAGGARVGLVVDPSEAVLTVADDGRGFVAKPGLRGHNLRARRLGLAGMRERASMLGGSFDIDSEPGRGTVVTVRLPLDEK
jgi:signal transduction histidine kinase